MAPRTLIIGLDGATFDVIDPLIQEGFLPTLGKLMTLGVRGPLRAWPNMNSAAAWSSMITGYNSGQHGIYDFGNTLTGRGRGWHLTTGADRRKDPFWRVLSSAGRDVGIVNVPITYPADRINGFMLAGMDTPTVHSPGFTHPPQLYAELRRQGIDYVIDIQNLSVLSKRSPHRLPEQVRKMVDARARTILHLMQSRAWDVLMAVFTATDRVQHAYWPGKGSRVDSPDWAPIRSLYQQIDEFLADALAWCGENTTVLLVSDHGFRPASPALHSLNPMFEQLGLLVYRRQVDGEARLLSMLLRQGRRILPYALQTPLAFAFPSLHGRALTAANPTRIDWSRTRVFAGFIGGVSINLRGRQPNGIVDPEEYAPLRDRVRDILLNLVDPISGSRVVRRVYRREEVYHGPFLEQAPDLVIDWDHQALGDSLSYPIGDRPVSAHPQKDWGSGKHFGGVHHPQGIFIAVGPHIKRGERLADACIYDIAPTVLYLQDQPIPADMDGKVLTDIFVDEHVQRHPVRLETPTGARSHKDESPLDQEGEQIIEKRLRDLGYIE